MPRIGKSIVSVLIVLTWLGEGAGSRGLCADRPSGDVVVLRDVFYKPGATATEYEKERCKLDLFLPEASGFPVLVWFHGGALTTGNKGDDFNVGIARALAQAGVGVAMANYRLSPQSKFPAYVEDAAAAVAWVHGHIAERGGSATKVYVGGHSAGGYLTLMVGLDDRYLRPHGLNTQAIAGLIPVSGQVMTHYTIREERGLNKDVILADEAAPIHYVRKDTPPLLVLYADHDLPARAEENAYLVAALKAVGNERVIQRQIPDRDHGSIAGKVREPGDPAATAILSFVNSLPAAPMKQQ